MLFLQKTDVPPPPTHTHTQTATQNNPSRHLWHMVLRSQSLILKRKPFKAIKLKNSNLLNMTEGWAHAVCSWADISTSHPIHKRQGARLVVYIKIIIAAKLLTQLLYLIHHSHRCVWQCESLGETLPPVYYVKWLHQDYATLARDNLTAGTSPGQSPLRQPVMI